MNRFDKAMDELDEELANGEITPAEHRRLVRELEQYFGDVYQKEKRRCPAYSAPFSDGLTKQSKMTFPAISV